eukprot:15449440-Alexandrium_andersonii.AAC.1
MRTQLSAAFCGSALGGGGPPPRHARRKLQDGANAAPGQAHRKLQAGANAAEGCLLELSALLHER